MNDQEASLVATVLVTAAQMVAQVPLEELEDSLRAYDRRGWLVDGPRWEAIQKQRAATLALIEAALPLWRWAQAQQEHEEEAAP